MKIVLVCLKVALLLVTGCAHGSGMASSKDLFDVLTATVDQDWSKLNAEAIHEAWPAFERIESLEGCDGAIFLQSTERTLADSGTSTLTLEITSASPPRGAVSGCVERLTSVTASHRVGSSDEAVRFVERLVERLRLQLGTEPGVIAQTVAAHSGYEWSMANEASGHLHRYDIEVRRENGLWLARFREFRDMVPGR